MEGGRITVTLHFFLTQAHECRKSLFWPTVCFQRASMYPHRDSNPNRQNRNLKSYPLDYGGKFGLPEPDSQEQTCLPDLKPTTNLTIFTVNNEIFFD